jgi:hypothetical protein
MEKQDIKESIIEKNYELLINFDNKEKVRIIRDEILKLIEEYLYAPNVIDYDIESVYLEQKRYFDKKRKSNDGL